MRELFSQFLRQNREIPASKRQDTGTIAPWKLKSVQKRLDLKGKVAEVYSRLLAYLRWHLLALEKHWLAAGLLSQPGDIFFLSLAEISHLAGQGDETICPLIRHRRAEFAANQQLSAIPSVIYGNPPAKLPRSNSNSSSKLKLQGIGASSGQVEGRIKIMTQLQSGVKIDRQTILVVPHADSGWSPVLARAGGVIAEVGGKLSHGAIIAREYGIPAVMDVNNATHLLKEGQTVRIDGQTGIVEIL
jgi:pyruvate,water dikinase